MTRVLVTGAAGLIGFAVAQRLAEDGAELALVDSFRKGGREELDTLARAHAGRITVLDADLSRAMPKLEHARSRPAFDVVFHLAAVVGVAEVSAKPWETLEVNLRSTLNVLEWTRAHGARALVFASSSENYASGVSAGQVPIPTPENVPLSIADPELPRWSYAASKIAGESAVFAAARGSFVPLVARVHNVYGPRMGPTHVIPELLARFHGRVDPLTVFGVEQTRSFLHVDDAARALLCLAQASPASQTSSDGARGVFNVGSEDEISIGALVAKMAAICEHHPRIDERPAPLGSVARRVPDTRKLRALGFAPRIDLDAGLRECWETLERSRVRA